MANARRTNRGQGMDTDIKYPFYNQELQADLVEYWGQFSMAEMIYLMDEVNPNEEGWQEV